MGRLEGKVAFITGATGGIGKMSSIMFAKEGAKVAVAGRRADEGNEVVKEIKAAGGEAIFVQTDVTEPESVERSIKKTVEAFGKLNVLYNNAGGSRPTDGPVTVTPIEEFWLTIKLDLFGTYVCCKYAIPEMIKAGGGSIINTGSIMGSIGMPNRDAYTAAKGGVVALTKSLAFEYGEHGIRSNVIVPGTVKTPRVMKMLATEVAIQKQVSQYLMGLIEPQDVTYAAIYLASDESLRTTAQTIGVDSGFLNTHK